VLDERAGERQRELGIVGGLAGDRAPVPAIMKLAYAAGVCGADLVGAPEFHEPAE
jgi:hypothetical protein